MLALFNLIVCVYKCIIYIYKNRWVGYKKSEMLYNAAVEVCQTKGHIFFCYLHLQNDKYRYHIYTTLYTTIQ